MFSVCLVATSGQHWEQQWSFVLSNFAPDKLYIIGEVDRKVRPFRDHISIESAKDIENLVLMMPDNGTHFQGNQSLVGFEHPEDCCYMFGSDRQILQPEQVGKEPDAIVYVPTSTNDTMYSFIAGAVTLYDRKVKHG